MMQHTFNAAVSECLGTYYNQRKLESLRDIAYRIGTRHGIDTTRLWLAAEKEKEELNP